MDIGFLFWLLMILWFVFRMFIIYQPQPNPRWGWGSDLLLFILFFLLGWSEFGFVIRGGR